MASLDWHPFVPDHILNLVPYPPGKPIEETKREFGIDHVVKLASNENPLGPSPLALAAIQSRAGELHLYPDGSHYNLKKKLSLHHGVAMSELTVGNGSNELIDLLIRVFVSKGSNVVSQEKAFIAYKICSELQGCGYKEAKLGKDFNVSVDSILKTIDSDTRLVILANPNNPTGTYLKREEVYRLAEACLERKILLVLDYAYWEYVTESELPDPIETFKKYPNVVVLKTFSKAYGLAGLRVGYIVADAWVVSTMEKARQPFNVGTLALEAAAAALDDHEFVARSRKLNIESLSDLQTELPKFGVKPYASQGNFLLVDFMRSAKDLYGEFLKRGVIIRPVINYGLPTFFRISAGLLSENQKLFQTMRDILK